MKTKKRERLTALFLCTVMVATTIFSNGAYALAADKSAEPSELTADGMKAVPESGDSADQTSGETGQTNEITEPESSQGETPEVTEESKGTEEPEITEEPKESEEPKTTEENLVIGDLNGQEENTVEPVAAQTLYTFENDDMTVEVKLPEGTVLPEGTELNIRQITDHKITKNSSEEEKADKARFDDITNLLKETADDNGNPVDGFYAYHAELIKDGEVYVPDGEMNLKVSYKNGALPEVFTGESKLKAMNVKAFNYTTVKDENNQDKTVVQDLKDQLTVFAFADDTIGSVQEIGFNAEKVTDFIVAWNGQDQTTEYTYADDDVTVKATLSQAGILPRGVELKATKVEDEKTLLDVQNKVEEKISEENKTLSGFAAYDIRFEKDGKEVEPDGAVNVSLAFKEEIKPDIDELLEKEKENGAVDVDENALSGSEVNVYHLNEQNPEVTAEEAGDVKVSVSGEAGVDKASFSTDSFSVFVITWEDKSQTVSLKCVDKNGNSVGEDTNKTLAPGLWYSVATISPDLEGYEYLYSRLNKYNSSTPVATIGLIDGVIKYKQRANGATPPQLGNNEIFLIYQSNEVSTKAEVIETLSLPNIDLKVYDYATAGWAEAVTAKKDGIGTNDNSGVSQGIVKYKLGTDGLPVRTQGGYNKDSQNSNFNKYGDSLETLFGSAYIPEKTEYEADGLFVRDADGYYSYDSSKNYAFLDGNRFKVYSGTSRDGNFYPFNEYGSTDDINNGFGMMMGMQFIQPKDGKINNQNMKFEFSGDDDVWVFIDGYLVLDLGGSHGKMNGSIDFNTGKVQVQAISGKSDPEYTKIYGTDSTLAKIAKAIGAENAWDLDDTTGTFKDWSSHSFKFFYTDHGGASNCKLKFNIIDIPEDSITVGKTITDTNMADYADADFNFKLYLSEEKEGSYKVQKNVSYELKELKNGAYVTVPGEYQTDSDGKFILKHNQIAVFSEIPVSTYYYVQETGIDSDKYDKVTINDTTNSDAEGNERGTATSPKYSVDKNSWVMFYNKCNASNRQNLTITKSIQGDVGQNETFHIKAEIGGKIYTGNYRVYTDGNFGINAGIEKTADKGYLELKPGETAVILDVLSDASYEITEIDLKDGYYFDPVYQINDGEKSTDPAEGTIKLGENTSVNVTNTKKVTDFELLKVDGGQNPLSGAVFKITGENGFSQEAVSGENGIVKFQDVPSGTYTMEELKAPYGYEKLADQWTWKVTVSKDGSSKAELTDKGGKLVELNQNGIPVIHNYTSGEQFEKSLDYDKTVQLVDWDDRTYQIDLSASSKLTQTSEYSVPYDIVLVFDTSVSMTFNFYNYVPYTGSSYPTSGAYYVRTTNGIYQQVIKDGNSQKWYYVDTASGNSKVYPAASQLYVRTKGNDKKQQAITAASAFLDMVKEKSEDSRVGVVFFDTNATVKKSGTNSLLRVGNDSSMSTLKSWIKNVNCPGNTDSGKGLAKAYGVLKGTDGTGERVSVNDGRRKMVLFMTDGVPASSAGRFNQTIANNAIAQADRIKNMDGDGSTVIYSVGIFDSADSNGTIYNGSVNDIDQYMASVATNQDYYMNADSLDTIGDVFESIGQTMGRTVTADVTDVIDARFELAEGERERLINNTGAEIKENADGTTTITWPNASIQAARGNKPGWEKTILVRAKDEFIGGNDVYTNASGSGISSDAGSVAFDPVPVNVKMDYTVGNAQDVIFWGDSVSSAGEKITARLFDAENVTGFYAENAAEKKYTIGRDGTALDAKDFTFKWSKDKEKFDDTGSVMTEEQTGMEKPDEQSVYYLQVKYNAAGDATDASNANTVDANGVSHQADEELGLYATNNQEGLSDKNVKYYQDGGKAAKYGVYIIDIVKGQLKITKDIVGQYTDIRQIRANQSFIFRVDRREETDGEIKDTYYAVLSFDANGNITEGTDKVTGLKKGYYTVTEETKWSSKYNLTETKDNYSTAGAHTAAVNLPIGERQGNTELMGKAGFYGTAPGYEEYAAENPAEVTFTNTLQGDYKWLSDVASAVNKFTRKK